MGDHLSFPSSSLHLLYWMSGHNDYLANLLVDDSWATRTKFHVVVCEFTNVFLNDFPSFSPICENKFTIYLIPSISHISIPSYRLAHTELKELKSQLEEL